MRNIVLLFSETPIPTEIPVEITNAEKYGALFELTKYGFVYVFFGGLLVWFFVWGITGLMEFFRDISN